MLRILICFILLSSLNVKSEDAALPKQKNENPDTPLGDDGEVKDPAANLLDYKVLHHKIILQRFRAGNYGNTLVHNYFFRVALLGLIDSDQERQLNEEARKQLEEEAGRFAYLNLSSLSYLPRDSKSKEISFLLKGEKVRDVVSETMSKFAVPEDKVAVKVKLQLFIEGKKYYFLEDNKLISESSYFALPYRSSEDKIAKDKNLIMKDENGLFVEVHVQYLKDDAKK